MPVGSSLGTGALFNFSVSGGGGAQLLLISFATTRQHGICNGSNDMEDGGHILQPTATALGLGISAPTHPKFPSFVWDW